ncbi:MAG: acylphosphatase [Proteobacteria bacterium]|nr:acylphosphatase [Pseudomonadota bacterium]
MPDAPHITRLLRIHGLVQGVYYRQSMIDAARRLGLQGWVRNRLDGTVEALASGPRDAVQALVDWAHRGPPAARVDEVQVQEVACQQPLQGFDKRATA